jgi:putative membrane protein
MTTPAAPRSPFIWIFPLSTGIIIFLFWLIYGKEAASTQADWVSVLPATNAFFNALSACCLIGGLLNIKRGNRTLHMRFMLSAVASSALFLIGYIIYHNFHGDTPFPGQGFIRPIYFFILISHIGLSIIALPLVFSTLYYAGTGQFQTHRKMARYTFPIWLYVSVTGVAVFFFLRVYA